MEPIVLAVICTVIAIAILAIIDVPVVRNWLMAQLVTPVFKGARNAIRNAIAVLAIINVLVVRNWLMAQLVTPVFKGARNAIRNSINL